MPNESFPEYPSQVESDADSVHEELVAGILHEDVLDLERRLGKKGILEKYIASYQTRQTPIPDMEGEKNRGEVFRFERGQIFKAYEILRNDIAKLKQKGADATHKEKLLDFIREKTDEMERNLDQLNKQYYENVREIPVETEYGNYTIPVVELDLNNDKTKQDSRPPIFLVGSIATTAHSAGALALALAMDGRRVFITTYPEQVKEKPENYKEILEQNGIKVHAAIQKKVIENLGISDVDLMGVSMGSAIAMEIATDKNFEHIHDLNIIEPVGIEQKGLPLLIEQFALDQGIRSALPAESRIKTIRQGSDVGLGINPDYLIANGKILSQKLFDAEKLSALSQKGRCNMWFDSASPLVNRKVVDKLCSETNERRQEENPAAQLISMKEIKGGGDHGWVFMNSLGFSRALNEELGDEADGQHVTKINLDSFENSGMARLLQELKTRV